MREGKEVAPGEGSRPHEALVERIVDAAWEAWEEQRPRAGSEARGARLRAGLEALAEAAEADLKATRAALRSLRSDRAALERLEACLDAGDPDEATLRLGAALQLAGAELSSPTPDLRARLPELMRWLDP